MPKSDPSFLLSATAACETTETDYLNDAAFTFTVRGNKTEDVRGVYKYGWSYEDEGTGNYEQSSYQITTLDGVTLKEGSDYSVIVQGERTGVLDMKADVAGFKVQFDVHSDEAQLSGQEAITFTLSNETVTREARASLSNDDLDCEPAPVTPSFGISAYGACEIDETTSKKDARFSFKVYLDNASTQAQVYEFLFSSASLSAEDYSLKSVAVVDGDGQSLADFVSHDSSSGAGSFSLPAGHDKFFVDVIVEAEDELSGNEELDMALANNVQVSYARASLADLDCPDFEVESEPSSSRLYLLTDNSTSMLGLDPATKLTSSANRLEAQARVAFASFKTAASQAGLGYRKKGDPGSYRPFDDEFYSSIILNTAAADLPDFLSDYELADDPSDDQTSSTLFVDNIIFGYTVNHAFGQFRAGANLGAVAKVILGLSQTPDQIYGNSIVGNPNWSDRGLSRPGEMDYFWGDNRLASNLYSGTEMLGALEGLVHLLERQLAETTSGSLDQTMIQLITDGRPERRSWWNTWEDAESDSSVGLPISLPDTLGGDAIDTSGLLYSFLGEVVELTDNSGDKAWAQMQTELNTVLDRIAALYANPQSQLTVSALGLGDDSEADFPKIYADLFGNRLFKPGEDTGWKYDYSSSYDLELFKDAMDAGENDPVTAAVQDKSKDFVLDSSGFSDGNLAAQTSRSADYRSTAPYRVYGMEGLAFARVYATNRSVFDPLTGQIVTPGEDGYTALTQKLVLGGLPFGLKDAQARSDQFVMDSSRAMVGLFADVNDDGFPYYSPAPAEADLLARFKYFAGNQVGFEDLFG